MVFVCFCFRVLFFVSARESNSCHTPRNGLHMCVNSYSCVYTKVFVLVHRGLWSRLTEDLDTTMPDQKVHTGVPMAMGCLS